MKCFSCGKENIVPGQVGRKDECSQCGADLHSCKCCVHHDPKVYNECKEPQADVVKERDRANFCDYYDPSTTGGKSGPSKADLLAAAEALFKKKSE
mgnify:CR=1 FL=1